MIQFQNDCRTVAGLFGCIRSCITAGDPKVLPSFLLHCLTASEAGGFYLLQGILSICTGDVPKVLPPLLI